MAKLHEALLRHAYKKKARDFNKAGYHEIEWQDIEHYFARYGWRKKRPSSLAAELRAIDQLSTNQYFDFVQLEATAWDVPQLEELDWERLLK